MLTIHQVFGAYPLIHEGRKRRLLSVSVVAVSLLAWMRWCGTAFGCGQAAAEVSVCLRGRRGRITTFLELLTERFRELVASVEQTIRDVDPSRPGRGLSELVYFGATQVVMSAWTTSSPDLS